LQARNFAAMAQNLPRVIEVGEGMHAVEILDYGTFMAHEHWSTRQAIFPKGWLSNIISFEVKVLSNGFHLKSKKLSTVYNITSS
jgi:hypothetical protein